MRTDRVPTVRVLLATTRCQNGRTDTYWIPTPWVHPPLDTYPLCIPTSLGYVPPGYTYPPRCLTLGTPIPGYLPPGDTYPPDTYPLGTPIPPDT